MFLRGYRICDAETIEDEITQIYRILTDLRYPEWFIHDTHMSARTTFFTRSRGKKDGPKNVWFYLTMKV